jgi:hypothetical protein
MEKAAGLSKYSSQGTYGPVIGVGVTSGILAALLNIPLAYGGEIIQRARSQGAQPAWAVYAVWSLVLSGALMGAIAIYSSGTTFLGILVPMKMDSDPIGQKVYLSAQGREPVRG